MSFSLTCRLTHIFQNFVENRESKEGVEDSADDSAVSSLTTTSHLISAIPT